MPYAILRFEKRRGGPASALEKHHERKKQQYASNPDIDTKRSEIEFSSCKTESEVLWRNPDPYRKITERKSEV